jgi:hypothetical protein
LRCSLSALRFHSCAAANKNLPDRISHRFLTFSDCDPHGCVPSRVCTYSLAQMKHIQVRELACVAVLILALCSPGWGMDMRAVGDQLIITGPLSGFEMTQFMSSLTPAVTTVVLYNSGGGDFDAGLNLAAMIRPARSNDSCARLLSFLVRKRLSRWCSTIPCRPPELRGFSRALCPQCPEAKPYRGNAQLLRRHD